jgi:two-component system LytT family response regulator
MLRTIIIDDEPHIRDTLSKMITLCCPKIEIVGEATGVATGISKILEAHPDLVFLDLNLDDGNGYELLDRLQPVDFKVIFISAFGRKTAQAFKLSNIAFLMKPFDPVELIEAVKMAEESDVKDLSLCLEALEENIRGVSY